MRENPQMINELDLQSDPISNFNFLPVDQNSPPKRRNGCFLDPTIPIKLLNNIPKSKPSRLREQIRRKSCYCTCCGGLSNLERKTLHVKFPIQKLKNESDSIMSRLQISPDKSEPTSMIITPEIPIQSIISL